MALEAALCFAFPWSSYYVAEALQLSGIVAILFCGILMATYARPNLSHHARDVRAVGQQNQTKLNHTTPTPHLLGTVVLHLSRPNLSYHAREVRPLPEQSENSMAEPRAATEPLQQCTTTKPPARTQPTPEQTTKNNVKLGDGMSYETEKGNATAPRR